MYTFVHDNSGHPCQVELSRELAGRGHTVRHSYCPSFLSARGNLEKQAVDPATFTIDPLPMRSVFRKYQYLVRAVQELRYGFALAAHANAIGRPDVVVLSNCPLLSLWVAAWLLRGRGVPVVLWHQDVYSEAVRSLTNSRRPRPLFRLLVALATAVERSATRACSGVVAISPDFIPVLYRWGVARQRLRVVPNWAAISEMPGRPRDNDWARSHDLVGRDVVMYTGTLGLKHNPRVLADLADHFAQNRPDARLVVVSEGKGRELLEQRQATKPVDQLLLLDYQPYDELPNVLGSADVLLVILEADAGRFSVPSKILNYLCAGRLILGLLPETNAAASLLRASGAGEVLSGEAGLAAVNRVIDEALDQPSLREAAGISGRRYAESTFDVTVAADTFEELFSVVGVKSAARPGRTS